jgi:hypothetical protein
MGSLRKKLGLENPKFVGKSSSPMHQEGKKSPAITSKPPKSTPPPPVPASSPKQEPPKPKKQIKQPFMRDRLPEGSTFWASYDAAKEEWVGCLTISIPARENALVFECKRSGIRGLLTALDTQWRRFLRGELAIPDKKKECGEMLGVPVAQEGEAIQGNPDDSPLQKPNC